MENVKYRVWCEFTINGEKHYEMASPENWFLLTQTGHLMSHGPMSFDPNAEQKHDKLIVEFFTGRDDENKEEICSGDRIEFVPVDDSTKVRQIAEVYYDKKRTAFCVKSKAWNCPLSSCKDIVIIGNIHENAKHL